MAKSPSSAASSHVATLVCNPERPALKVALLEAVLDAIPDPGSPDWLQQGVAVDLPFDLPDHADLRDVSARARAALTGAEVDIIVQPSAQRRKKLLLADMDSTMIGQECIDELAAYAGLKEHVSAITERAMRGELAFEPALRERVALLKGLPVTNIDDIIEHRLSLTPGGRTLIATMRKHGAYTCLVSGGFTLFSLKIAAAIGFDENRANQLLVEADRLLGTVAEPILGKEAKLATLVELRGRLGLSTIETLAVGDGANDLAMLQEAGLGIAYHAKPNVAEAAHGRLDHGDLSALLYVQGYHRHDFVL
jgi:phosphoserine phosphatase